MFWREPDTGGPPSRTEVQDGVIVGKEPGIRRQVLGDPVAGRSEKSGPLTLLPNEAGQEVDERVPGHENSQAGEARQQRRSSSGGKTLPEIAMPEGSAQDCQNVLQFHREPGQQQWQQWQKEAFVRRVVPD